MLGREAYQNPWMLAEVDASLFGMDKTVNSRDDVIAALLPYVEQQLARGAHLNHITRHILGLYQGVPGARKFRRHLSENAYKKEAGLEVLTEAYRLVRNRQPTIELSRVMQRKTDEQARTTQGDDRRRRRYRRHRGDETLQTAWMPPPTHPCCLRRPPCPTTRSYWTQQSPGQRPGRLRCRATGQLL